MLKTRKKLSHLFLIFLIAYGCAPAMLAQTTTTGAIQGKVYDTSGQGIPNAVVTATNQETGLKRSTATGVDGGYWIATLPPGWYTIAATADGYEQGPNSSESNFGIKLSKTNTVTPPPITLQRAGSAPTAPPPQPGAQQAQAGIPETESQAEQLTNTTNASRGGNFNRRDLLALPLPGVRSFDDLAFLVPGVVPPPKAIGTTVGPGIGPGVGTSGQFSVNGIRSRSNNFTIDGSDNNDEEVGVRRQGFTSLVPQPIESVQEFQITTLLPESQFGRNSGAQVNAVSRSGGTGIHGTLYGFFTDKRLKARDAFDLTGGPANFPIARSSDGQAVRIGRLAGSQIADNRPLAPANPVGDENPFTRAQYGFVVGGPIVQQKTLFFFSFEHQDINASRESNFAVPTVAERGLAFNGLLTGDTGLNVGTGAFPTSATGDLFFSLFPFPNNPAGPYGPNTYTEILPASADGTIFSGKIDHQFNAFGKDHVLTGRYNFTDDDTILPVTGEAIFSSLRALVRTQNLSLIFNSVISPKTTNQARVSYGRTSLNFEEVRNPFLVPSRFSGEPFLLNAPLIQNVTLPGTRPQYLIVPGVDTESGFGPNSFVPGTGPIGQVIISGFSPVGVDVFNFPQGRTNNTFQFADTIIFDLSKQRITAGFDIRRNQLNSFLERNFRPLAVFSAAANLLKTNPGQVGQTGALQGLGDFLFGPDFAAVGAPTGFFQTQALFRDSTIGLRYWQTNFFLVDQFRLRPNFTLTLGARYELNTVPTETNRRIESTFGSQAVQGFQNIERQIAGGVSGLERFLAGRTKIFERDNNNIAPHIAFAWDPFNNGKMSVRGGYGIYYDQIPGAVISQSRNVFPSFLTVNTAGVIGPNAQFMLTNPASFAAPGTLNTFAGGDPVRFLSQLAAQTAFSSGTGFVLPAADLVTPYAQHWGLTIEREIEKDFLASFGYVGTRGVHLLRFATPNLGPNGIPVVLNALISDSGQPTFVGLNVPPNFGRPFPLLGSFTSIESDANSTYHGLQLQLNKRFSRGIQFTTAYTWSHAIDEVSDIFDLAGTRALPQNSFDRRAERGDANFDVRHRFVYSLIWDVPIFEGNNMLGDWQVSSIGTFQTGQPYTVLFCCDFNLDGNLTDRPGLVIGGLDSGRNTFRAPGIATVDLAINKGFRFSENNRLEFRTEVFNLFNRTHFGIPVHQLFFGGFGVRPLSEQNFVDTLVPARTIQFALKFNF